MGLLTTEHELGDLGSDFKFGPGLSHIYVLIVSWLFRGGGGGGKALTMTMTPWNLPHGQWSKKLTMTTKPSILPMVNGQIDQF